MNKGFNLSRRDVLRGVGAAGVCCAAAGGAWTRTEPAGERSEPIQLSKNLFVLPGPVNVGVIRKGERALLIDCGDGSTLGGLERIGVKAIEAVLCTHHHRDNVCALGALAARGARVYVPAKERDQFDRVADYWNDPEHRFHQYYFRPHHLTLAEPVRVDMALDETLILQMLGAGIVPLATPGHTDGSLSYLVEMDDQKTLFTGDLIYDGGRVWDIYSLQKGFSRPGRTIRDYHGFMGAKFELAESLEKVKATGASRLVPSHGPIITDPAKAIDALSKQMELCYDQYVSISALRHYFPESFSEYAGRKDHMAFSPHLPPPAWVRQIKNTWLIISESKAAFVMDCWDKEVVAAIQKLMADGEIRSVEGLWVTHYHDDHTNGIAEFQKTFDCPCITDRHVADVITKPRAWRLPCLSPTVARVDKTPAHGESWQWREFRLTSYYFPGQTLYHGGLLVEGRDHRMFFTGDSFTPAGIDDYCAMNRNWLGRDVGFDRCIAILEKLKPTLLFNCHVEVAWTFTPEQYRFMRERLAEREKSFGWLVPWDHANYALDESWVRCYPYEQDAPAGQRVEFQVVVTNHSDQPRKVACRAVLPAAWDGARVTDWVNGEVPAKTEGSVSLSLTVPAEVAKGRYIVPVDVRYGSRSLPQFTEAIVVV